MKYNDCNKFLVRIKTIILDSNVKCSWTLGSALQILTADFFQHGTGYARNK